MFLDNLFSSIFQNFKNTNIFEVIVINDGSNYEETRILETYTKEFNIKIFNKDNGGVSSAKNYGLKVSSGKFLWFVDLMIFLLRTGILILLN